MRGGIRATTHAQGIARDTCACDGGPRSEERFRVSGPHLVSLVPSRCRIDKGDTATNHSRGQPKTREPADTTPDVARRTARPAADRGVTRPLYRWSPPDRST